ncbi:DUF998 domain-containing protein [Nakamurella lactea]|uniref:DUF998 domain-containing protein n=1 Tax=Nakamurella lactea TaxID=459515 RepID=UPI001B7FC125|nr:DUF998 domain-containing protein [Nakamurella lactea]
MTDIRQATDHVGAAGHPPVCGLTKVLGWAGVAGGVLAAVAVLTLDLVIGGRPLRGKPMRLQTISEYVYSPGSWAFNTAIVALAAGSAALLIGLVRRRLVRPISPGSILLTLWGIGLLGIVAFPKHNWAVGPSGTGTTHRVASLIAFVALPVGVLLAAGWRRNSTAARAASALAVGALCCLSVLLGAIVVAAVSGGAWWQLIPLGVVERGIAGFEVAAVIALGCWLIGSADPDRDRGGIVRPGTP